MKRLILLAALIISLPSFGQIRSASLTASGLTCSMCSKAIYKALSAVPFIEKVDANVETSTYSIQFKQGENIVLDDVKKAVQGAGFSVAGLQVTANFNNTEVYNDAHIEIGGSTFHFLDVTKQVLQGEKTFSVIGKNYVTAAQHKKYKKFTKMACFETGVMGSCCPSGKAAKRVYHVTI